MSRSYKILWAIWISGLCAPLFAELPHIEIATWNLECFNSGTRGFPENQHGGPTYGPRDAEGLATIAYLIRKHGMDVIGLQEIMSEDDLAALAQNLPGFRYYVLSDQARQHCALLWDPHVATVTIRPPLAALAVSPGQREGLLCWIRSGALTFDLLVVHLAGDKAKSLTQIELLRRWLHEQNGLTGRQDDDALIVGDFNLTPQDAPLRALLNEPGLCWGFADVWPLPPTRPFSHKTIDHIFMTWQGYQELRLGPPIVPREDIWFGARYRALISDHLPVIQSFRIDRD